MEQKVERLMARLVELEDLLGDPQVTSDQKRYRDLAQEHAQLSELKECWQSYVTLKQQLKENKELLKSETDEDLVRLIHDDIESLETRIDASKGEIENLLVPPDPLDSNNTIIEIRAGTGGEEAALFVADCIRMYRLYADSKGWKYEVLSSTESDLGGFKEHVMVLSGPNVHRFLQYEAGTHRVQRVPETETQGRVHTSAITVAVLSEPSKEEKIDFDEKDLEIDTYRASGAGGQHVNTTDSAVRITHVPTGTVVTCQDERSQHKNKEKALRLLSAKIAEEVRRKQHAERSALRSSQVGSGDRSERIRTYNFPQNRVTDHRINLTLYKLDQVMEGSLDELTQALVAFFYQQKMQS